MARTLDLCDYSGSSGCIRPKEPRLLACSPWTDRIIGTDDGERTP